MTAVRHLSSFLRHCTLELLHVNRGGLSKRVVTREHEDRRLTMLDFETKDQTPVAVCAFTHAVRSELSPFKLHARPTNASGLCTESLVRQLVFCNSTTSRECIN